MNKDTRKMHLHPQEQFHLMEQQRETNLKRRRTAILGQMQAKRACYQSLSYDAEDEVLVCDRTPSTVAPAYVKKEANSQEEEEASESESEKDDVSDDDGETDDDDNNNENDGTSELSSDGEGSLAGKDSTVADSEDSDLFHEAEVSDFF